MQFDKEAKIYLAIIGVAIILALAAYFIFKPSIATLPLPVISSSDNQTPEEKREELLKGLVAPAQTSATSTPASQTTKSKGDLLKGLVAPTDQVKAKSKSSNTIPHF